MNLRSMTRLVLQVWRTTAFDLHCEQRRGRGYSIVVLGRRLITLLRFAFLRDLPLALWLDFT